MSTRGRPFELGNLSADVTWLDRIGSTNDYLAALAPNSAPRLVLSWNQMAGRGRLGRQWLSPNGDSLALSIDLGSLVPRPTSEDWLGTLPLVAGSCLAEALAGVLNLAPRMKWPNDVLVEGSKVAGILGEIPEPGRVILGIGLNVWEAPDAIDPATVTALSEWGLSGHDAVARAVESFVSGFFRRVEKGGDQLGEENREFIREHLATVGQSVRVSMPDGSTVVGVASDVDGAGRLVVTTASRDVVISAGDIEHLRTAQ